MITQMNNKRRRIFSTVIKLFMESPNKRVDQLFLFIFCLTYKHKYNKFIDTSAINFSTADLSSAFSSANI